MKRAFFLAVLLSRPAQAAALRDRRPRRHVATTTPTSRSPCLADNFVAEKNRRQPADITGTYSGNVIITQGDIRMRANTVRIVVVEQQAAQDLRQRQCGGGFARSGTATGDNGVYDVVPRLVTLTGHVVLTKEKNVMRGAQLTVNLVTGVAQLGGGARQRDRRWPRSGLIHPSAPDRAANNVVHPSLSTNRHGSCP